MMIDDGDDGDDLDFNNEKKTSQVKSSSNFYRSESDSGRN